MTTLTRSSHPLILFSVALLAALFFAPAVSAQQTGDEVNYIGVIRGSGVHIRSGAAETYYPFGKLEDGDLIKVSGEKFDWVRVAAAGPAFSETYGYVKYAANDNSRVRLSADGKSAVTLGKTDIIAPNLDTKGSPKDSWKSIARLEADQTLRIIEKTQTDKDIILKVVLPESAQGWVSKAYVDRANEAQIAQWNAALSGSKKPAQQPQANPKPAPPVQPQPKPRTAEDSPSAGNGDSTPTVKPQNRPTPPTPTPSITPADAADDQSAAEDDHAESSDATPVEESTDAADSNKESAKPAEKRPPTLDQLENAYKVLMKESSETAEFGALRELYLDLAKRSAGEPLNTRRALVRADQLELLADLQRKRSEVQDARMRLKMNAAETDAVRKALESSAEYVAVGRVIASPIYDGERLPKLLRVQDAATSRTLAYLHPDEEYELVNLIGNVVGIVGEKNYDEGLRLNLITPKRIDILTPQERAEVKTDGGH